MNRHLLFIGLFVAMLAIDPAIQGQSTPSCGPLPFPEAILPEGTDVKTSADLIAACSQKYGKDWTLIQTTLGRSGIISTFSFGFVPNNPNNAIRFYFK